MKKNYFLLTLLVLLLNQMSFGQSTPPAKRITIIKPTSKQLLKIKEIGIDLSCGAVFIDNNLTLELDAQELNALDANSIKYKVNINDLKAHYEKLTLTELPKAKMELENLKTISRNSQKSLSTKTTTVNNFIQYEGSTEIDWATPQNFQLGSMAGCLTYAQVLEQLDLMRTKYPNLISAKTDASPTNQKTHGNAFTNGGVYQTWPGQTIYFVRISDNPDVVEANEPESMYSGMTHSREVSSLMNLMYYMWYVLENYSTDPGIKNLVDNHQMYFIPVVNPDGLKWNEQIAPSGGGLQRKNLNPTANPGNNNARGVDLNRNFNYFWGGDARYAGGSSPTQSDQTYRGIAAASEPETKIISAFALSRNFKTAINHHAFQNNIPHAYNGYPAAPSSGRENEYAKFCQDLTRFNRYIYGEAPDILTIANGDLSDWLLGGVADVNGSTGSGKQVLALAPENGAATGEGDFWPSPSLIPTIAKRAMRMNFVNAYYSGKFAQLHDLNTSDITTTSGDLKFGLEYLGQTLGNLTLTVTPVSANITSITSPPVQTGWTKLAQRTLTAAFELDPNIKDNEVIEFKVSLSNDDGYVMYETTIVKNYNPTVIFANNPDATNIAAWTSTPASSWGTTSDAFSGTTALTDSPAGAYTNNLSKTLRLTNSVNLSGAAAAVVQFYAKWDLERNFDYVQLQGSTDGTNWVPLNGKYTKPGASPSTTPYNSAASTNTSTGKTATDRDNQPDGQPVYEADTMDKWVMEEIYISPTENSFLHNSSTARFRFLFDSDNSNRRDGYSTTFDGFVFDDFKVVKIPSAPPVAICKTATVGLDSSGNATLLPAAVNNNSTDDVAITTITVSPNTFNCTHIGTPQTVTLSVTDADGQTRTCTTTVTIVDNLNPVPTVTTLTTLTAQCSMTPTAPTALDNCSGTITGTTTTSFPITNQGTTVVTWTYTDANGNSSNQTQNVTIDDTIAPAVPTLASISGQCSVTPTAPTTTDNCAGTITGTTTTTFPITETTAITWTFNDGNGQQVTANQTVTIGSTTWNGTNWSAGIPVAGTNAIINGNLTITENITACNLTVNNTAVVLVKSGFNLNIFGNVTVASGATLTFENNANLIQSKNTNGNTGNIIVNRKTSPLMLLDYVLWSSPVASQQLQAFSPATLSNRFYTYNPATNLYNAIASTNPFSTGKAYLIRMPNTHPTTPTIWDGQFRGVPNNGTYTISVSANAFNAIGNPYPSTVNANTFISTNNLTEPLYFWRKTNNSATTSYATYTTAGGTANAGGASSIIPNGIIQVGQGFIVKSPTSAITFNNGMRLLNNDDQFLRTNNSSTHRIWLNLNKENTAINQMMIAYLPKATTGIDATIDGRYINDNSTALNSLINNEEFVIQGRGIPFENTDTVPLSFKTSAAGDFSIAIDHVDGLFLGDQAIYINDKVTGLTHDLKKSAYTFSATAGIFNDRFNIVYKTDATLGLPENVAANDIIVYNENGVINIKSSKTAIKSIKVFDIRGRMLFEKNGINNTSTSLARFTAANQTLIIQITSEHNQSVSKKLIY
ncbi:M14 family zinc carboxypeptidase [Flavobacterium turcicum]|uniref:T9SS sorting signal type C domain-containing protein n=1 Tax=Flavobacterium turcicum TaxID=2764718 RepID=A0ABR7JG80_9FLAO|nr:M14 family zinc carboxypeptidase [Flavobacterium turcicum]MBC5863511.1 T9SS sorting signal type C domain-containing protein [Flavobacterium turcicum]NHL02539.1 T9SS sorting signal type C domain-containing protein [Flavobacterium turcicum]